MPCTRHIAIACFAASIFLAGAGSSAFAAWNSSTPRTAAARGAVVVAQMGGNYGNMRNGGMSRGGFQGQNGKKGKGGFHQGGGGPGGHFGGGGAPGAAAEHTVPYNCHRICSGYLSHTRCDGSQRSPRYPVHHGVDIHIRQGTPLVAIAAGEIVSSQVGDSIGGINVVVRHPPGTVRPHDYVFTMYKHLRSRSPLAPGTHVKRGQRIATSGNSGTADRYFGPGGFSHLHFETYVSSSAHWPGGKMVSPVGILRGQGWPIACR